LQSRRFATLVFEDQFKGGVEGNVEPTSHSLKSRQHAHVFG